MQVCLLENIFRIMSLLILLFQWDHQYHFNSYNIHVLQIILECTGEAPENVTVILQCNETGIVFNTTYTVESDSRPMDITEQLSIPQYQECNISALFRNANGSDSSIMEFCKICLCPCPVLLRGGGVEVD